MKALNPSTGNLEEVYVKALDSLPVGTIVDYDGQTSDIPTGWVTYGTGQIKKTSETRALSASVVNASNNSTTNTYSCDYINKFGKKLWEGSFTSDSITVDGLSNYTLFAMKVGAVYCFGSRNYGLGGLLSYGSYSIGYAGYRLGGSGDTLTIDNANRGGSYGSSNEPISEIWGLF